MELATGDEVIDPGVVGADLVDVDSWIGTDDTSVFEMLCSTAGRVVIVVVVVVVVVGPEAVVELVAVELTALKLAILELAILEAVAIVVFCSDEEAFVDKTSLTVLEESLLLARGFVNGSAGRAGAV